MNRRIQSLIALSAGLGLPALVTPVQAQAAPQAARATATAAHTTATAARPEQATRREQLLGALGDGITLVLGSHEPSPDFLPWQQAREFLYLTDFREPDGALVMVERGGTRQEILFVRPKDPAREVWNGHRLGVDGVREQFGMEGREAATLRDALDELIKKGGGPLYVVGDLSGNSAVRTRQDQFIDEIRAAHPGLKVENVSNAVGRLRGKKSTSELARIRTATEISAAGHLAVMRAIQPDIAEFQIQGMAEGAWRIAGADGPGYTSIVGSGPNATTLHYNANDRIARDGEVIVMDMAASFDGYSSDITRTVPVNGKFSPAQRDIYEIVLGAQKAAERQVRAGGPSRAMTDSATFALRAGLARIGLIESADAMYDCGTTERARECSQLSLYYMHGLGHGVGLDVHDPDQYATNGRIDVGSAFTIEPGIYVRSNLMGIISDTPRNRAFKAKVASAFARYAGIGVRVEDVFLVTEAGVERPSAGVPREMDEIERELARPRPPLPARRTP